MTAAGRSYLVLEASDRWGGRCFTDMRTFGIPYERGARWIYMPDTNPMAKLAITTGLNIDRFRLKSASWPTTRRRRSSPMADAVCMAAPMQQQHYPERPEPP
jgi:phytoene dehydrogenase-like protein